MKQKKKKIKLKIKGLKGTYHFWLRSEQRNITLENIQRAVKYGTITDADEGKKRLIYDNVDIILIPEKRKMITIISKGEIPKKNTVFTKDQHKKISEIIKSDNNPESAKENSEIKPEEKPKPKPRQKAVVKESKDPNELTYEEYLKLGKTKK